jgi:beta-phosphoglucomutase
MRLKAAIFDIDGTMIDNNAYHLQAWREYLQNIGRQVTDQEYKANINGRTNHDAVEYIYGRSMSVQEAEKFYLEKERIYRRLYAPDIKPVAGLEYLLQQLQQTGVSMAIATSGIMVNIDFLFQHIPIKEFFSEIVYSKHIQKGKPDPEIYNITAQKLAADAADCIVFEDSIAGIQAAKSAGMKVVAITTTHPADELRQADKIVSDFSELSVDMLDTLL